MCRQPQLRYMPAGPQERMQLHSIATLQQVERLQIFQLLQAPRRLSRLTRMQRRASHLTDGIQPPTEQELRMQQVHQLPSTATQLSMHNGNLWRLVPQQLPQQLQGIPLLRLRLRQQQSPALLEELTHSPCLPMTMLALWFQVRAVQSLPQHRH